VQVLASTKNREFSLRSAKALKDSWALPLIVAVFLSKTVKRVPALKREHDVIPAGNNIKIEINAPNSHDESVGNHSDARTDVSDGVRLIDSVPELALALLVQQL